MFNPRQYAIGIQDIRKSEVRILIRKSFIKGMTIMLKKILPIFLAILVVVSLAFTGNGNNNFYDKPFSAFLLVYFFTLFVKDAVIMLLPRFSKLSLRISGKLLCAEFLVSLGGVFKWGYWPTQVCCP